MWVERLHVRGFRRLRGAFAFDKGLTLVIGDNEAGKSSLHQAVIRALFGFGRGERVRHGGVSVKDECAPWLEAEFGVNAVVHEVRGRSLRIEWEFGAHRVTLLDAGTGEDLSHEVRLKREEVRLGPYLTGLTLDDFRGVCCLDQAAIDAVQRTDHLVLALQQSIESTARDHGVDTAVSLLDDRLRDAGVHVTTLAPSASGPLANAVRERDALHAELLRAEEIQRRIAAHAMELARIRESLASRRRELDTIDQQLLLADRDRLQRTIEQASQLRSTSADGAVEPSPPVAMAHVARVDEISAALRAMRRAIEPLEAAAAAVPAVVARLERARHEVQRELQSKPGAADVDPAFEPHVRQILTQRVRLLDRQRAAGASGWRTAPLLASVALAVASLTLGMTLHRSYFAGLLIAAAIAVAARGWKAASERRAAVEAVKAVERELSDVLDAARATAAAAMMERAERYLESSGRHLERARLQLRLDALDAELTATREPLTALRRAREEESALTRELRAAYMALGLDDADLSRAADTLRGRIERAAQEQRQRARADAAADALRGLLGGETLEALAARARQAADAYAAHVQEHGVLNAPADAREALRLRSAEHAAAVQRLHRQETELETLMLTLESSLPDVAELKERLALLNERVERIGRASGAIAIARSALEEAARETHRKFAPFLNDALRRHLPRITAGRYANAVVDEDLRIRVQAPETGTFVPVDVLSRGTQDQIYFIQRLEIVRLLDPATGEAPLLLDDAFTRFDADRLRSAFEILAEVAAERQVVLFTEDEGMVRIAGDLGVRCAVIRLPAPSTRADVLASSK